jgi:hypothetical protein
MEAEPSISAEIPEESEGMLGALSDDDSGTDSPPADNAKKKRLTKKFQRLNEAYDKRGKHRCHVWLQVRRPFVQ